MTEHLDHLDAEAALADSVDALHGATTPTDVPFTVEEVLGMAQRVERTASICLAANLQGEWDRLVDELSTLVTPTGEVLDSAEASMGEESAEGRAIAIQDRLNELRREMRKKMWHVTFRAMPSDDYASFVKRFMPKNETGDRTEFFNRLICETAVSPQITMENIKALRSTLGPSAIRELVTTATAACTAGGLDVPKLPAFLRNLGGE